MPGPAYAALSTAKVSLLAAALPLVGPQVTWLAWVDAGIVEYRGSPPPRRAWPHPAALAALPRDKVIYTGARSGGTRRSGAPPFVRRPPRPDGLRAAPRPQAGRGRAPRTWSPAQRT